MKSIAVIGAGITGLTTSFLLKNKNLPVDLYEASERPGGVIYSKRQDGYLAEFGPNTLLNTNKKLEYLFKISGLSEHIKYAEHKSDKRFLVRNGKVIAMPSKAISFFLSPLFSWKAKYNLMLEPFRPRWKNAYEESVAQFVRRRFGNEFLTYAIDALVAGIFAGNPERLSVIHGFPKLYKAEQEYGSMIRAQFFGAKARKKRGETSKQEARILSFDEGLQVMPDTLAKNLGKNFHSNCLVTTITQIPSGWRISYRQGNELKQQDHSAVLLSTSAYAASQIDLQCTSSLNLGLFSKISYAPVSSVVLGYKRKDVGHPLDGFGMLLPGIEKFNILGTLFSSTLFSNRAPQGCVTLSSYVGGMRQPELAGLPQEKLFKMVHFDLAKLLNIRGEPVFQISNYYPRAIPQYNVGYGQFKDHVLQLQKDCPGFYIGGNYTRGPALSDNILSGFEFADNIENYLKTVAPFEV